MTRHFLPQNEATHRRRKHGRAGRDARRRELGQEQFDEARDFGEVLANLRTLEKMPAAQTATQDEMPRQQRTRFTENLENLALFAALFAALFVTLFAALLLGLFVALFVTLFVVLFVWHGAGQNARRRGGVKFPLVANVVPVQGVGL